MIAVLTDDYDVALGFSVSEGCKLHYVHVHKDMRKQGIARSLDSNFEVEVITHLTKMSMPEFGVLRLQKQYSIHFDEKMYKL